MSCIGVNGAVCNGKSSGGKVKHSCIFFAKTSLKLVSTKNKVCDSFCPEFHTAPFSPTPKGTPLVKVSTILSRNGFHVLKMALSCSESMI
jgi:hypothetical protein